MIVDSAEQATARPIDYQEQKRYYSGKKKLHTLKNHFIVLPNAGDIVDISVGKLVKTSDINFWLETRDKFAVSPKFIGDKAYIGEPAILTIYKKHKNAEISELQKDENQRLSSRRIGIEHLIRRVKIFRVTSAFGTNQWHSQTIYRKMASSSK